MNLNIWGKLFSHSLKCSPEERTYRDYLYDLILFAHRLYFYFGSYQGESIFKEDWDYLIVLDACRYDYFAELNEIDGKLGELKSKGSNTNEWAVKNFKDEYDITYISGTPMISGRDVTNFKGTEHFSEVINVWDYGWEEKLDTVPPETVTNSTLEYLQNNESRKLIIHYKQPHGPWLGHDFKSELSETGGRYSRDIELWKEVIRGNVSVQRVKEAYKDNLKSVLSEVERLIRYLEGKIIITADHGEAFGDKFIYEHPAKIYINELITVPWFEVSPEETGRKDVEKLNLNSLSLEPERIDSEQFDERLRGLGYL